MAITRSGTSIQLAADGDALTERLNIRAMTFTTGVAAATAADPISVLDNDGEVIVEVHLIAQSSHTISFGSKGWNCDGLELDASPALSFLTLWLG